MSRVKLRRVVLAAAPLAAGVVLAMGGCGSSSPESDQSPLAHRLHGTPTTPPYNAPPLRLRNYDGREVNLRTFRGEAVLVTFVYTHCPDVCPLIVSNLRAARSELGPDADRLQIIAVSVDPKGDTPKTVARFLQQRQMAGHMDYLIGSRPELERTWRA